MQTFFNFWDDPEGFPESLQFGFEPVADGKGKILNLRMSIEGLSFEMLPLCMGDA